MSNTPETDREEIVMGRTECDRYVLAEFSRRLERERDKARGFYKVQVQYLEMAKREIEEAIRQLENLKASAIHTCHDQCQRPMCVLRRERDELLERNAKLRDIADRALMLNQTQ